jgi:hypothetical protein
MKRTSSKIVPASQFDFLASLVGLPRVWAKEVHHLMRFWQSGEFNESISYAKWLEFYTPLCERGVQ